MFAVKPDAAIIVHVFPKCLKVLSAIPRLNRLVGKCSVAREFVVSPVCRQKFRRLAVRRGKIIIWEFGVIRPKVVTEDSVILLGIPLHASDEPGNMLSPLAINEKDNDGLWELLWQA